MRWYARRRLASPASGTGALRRRYRERRIGRCVPPGWFSSRADSASASSGLRPGPARNELDRWVRRVAAFGLHHEAQLVADMSATVAVHELGAGAGADLARARDEAEPVVFEAPFQQPARRAEERCAAMQFGAVAGKYEALRILRVRPVVRDLGLPDPVDGGPRRRLIAQREPGADEGGAARQQTRGP